MTIADMWDGVGSTVKSSLGAAIAVAFFITLMRGWILGFAKVRDIDSGRR